MSGQLLVVSDSASASRNLHEDDQGHRLLSVFIAADFFPLANDPYISRAILYRQNSQYHQNGVVSSHLNKCATVT